MEGGFTFKVIVLGFGVILHYSLPPETQKENKSLLCEVTHEYKTADGKDLKFPIRLYCEKGKAIVYYAYHLLDTFNVETCDPDILGSRFLVSQEQSGLRTIPSGVTLYIINGGGYCEYRDYKFTNFKNDGTPDSAIAVKGTNARCSIIFPYPEGDNTYEKLLYFDYCTSLSDQLTSNIVKFRNDKPLASEFFPMTMNPTQPSHSEAGHKPLLSCSIDNEGADFMLLCAQVGNTYIAYIMEGNNKLEKAVVSSCDESTIIGSILPPRYSPQFKLTGGKHIFRYKKGGKWFTRTYDCAAAMEITRWCKTGAPELVDCPGQKGVEWSFYPVSGPIGVWEKCTGNSKYKPSAADTPVDFDTVGAKKRGVK